MNDYDDTLDDTQEFPSLSKDPPPSPDLKDAVIAEHPSMKHSPCFEFNEKQIYKSRYLNQAFENLKKPGSTDQLKRVADVLQYTAKSSQGFDDSGGVFNNEPTSGRNVVQMDSPIATLIHCSSHLFLCIGEVNDIVVDF